MAHRVYYVLQKNIGHATPQIASSWLYFAVTLRYGALWRWARLAELDGALLIGAAHGVLPAVVAGTALHKAPQALAVATISLCFSLPDLLPDPSDR
jgi:hypothetical protein